MKKFFQIAGFPVRLPLFLVLVVVGGLSSCIMPGFFDESDWINGVNFLRGA